MTIAPSGSFLLRSPMPSVLETHAQLNAIEAWEAPRVFDHVLPWDFYDGIETGLAVSRDRLHYRVRSIGDSRSSMFRAFVLIRLPDFNPDVLLSLADSPDGSRDACIDADVWKYIQAATSGEDFVAIGDGYMRRIVCRQVTGVMPETFAAAHRYLADKFRPWRSPPQPD